MSDVKLPITPRTEPTSMDRTENYSSLKRGDSAYLMSDTSDVFTQSDRHSEVTETSWYKQAYYKTALWFRRTFMLSKAGKANTKGTAGVSGSAFNQIKYSNDENSRKLYLGMIPDQKGEKQWGKGADIPGGWEELPSIGTVQQDRRPAFKCVAILEHWEAENMNPAMRAEATIVESQDNVGMKPDEINRGVEALHQALTNPKDTRPVYLHCKSGVGRSPTVLAAYLMKYQGKTLQEAIEIIERDRPDVHLRKSTWFGLRSADTKHAEALKVWFLNEELKNIVSFLGPTFSWSETTKQKFGKFLADNPQAIEWIRTVTKGKPGAKEIMAAGAEILMLTQEAEDAELSQIGAAFQQRSSINTQFHTDGFPDLPFMPEIMSSGTMNRWNKNKAAFSRKKIEDPDFQSANAYLRKQLGILDSKPFWMILDEPGMFNRHAGWIVEEAPTSEKKSKLKLRRTLVLMDGPRVRVASVPLIVDRELSLEEAQNLIKQMWRKAESPSMKNSEIFTSQDNEHLGINFLTACDERIEQMREELVEFKQADPEQRDLTLDNWSSIGELYAGPQTDLGSLGEYGRRHAAVLKGLKEYQGNSEANLALLELNKFLPETLSDGQAKKRRDTLSRAENTLNFLIFHPKSPL